MNTADTYELVVGLEIHAQLLTSSKLFCSDDTRFGAAPNTQVSLVSLAHPGTLPVLNWKAIELAVKLGLSLDCDIESYNYFARKNYFYPDLPKGYQISQHTAPVCKGGHITIKTDGGKKKIALNRIHVEEDAGKSIHDADPDYSLIDLNRAGLPLVEIVTEPVIHSADDAFQFLTELRKLLRWLEVCDGNMEEGSMRCDANISIRPKGAVWLGKRVEVKNLNSIRNVKKAIELEFSRLVNLSENHQEIVQETRSYDADKNMTFSLRSKEDAEDYRYFPEPDLPPFVITKHDLASFRSGIPELPGQARQRCIDAFGLSEYDSEQICADKDDLLFFEKVIEHTTAYKSVANWMTGPLKHFCNEAGIAFSDFPVSHKSIADLITLTDNGKLSFQNASTRVFKYMVEQPYQSSEQIAKDLNLIQESDEQELLSWIEEVISSMPEKVKEYKSGKKGLIGLFSGEVKKRSKGRADMQLVNKLLSEKLNQ